MTALPRAAELARKLGKTAVGCGVLAGPLPLSLKGFPETLLVFEKQAGPSTAVADLVASVEGRGSSAALEKLAFWRSLKPDPGLVPAFNPADFSSNDWAADLLHLLNGGKLAELNPGSQWRSALEDRGSAPDAVDRCLAGVVDQYLRGFSPYDAAPLSFEELTDCLALLQGRYRANSKPAHCVGVKYWNHKAVAAHFKGQGASVTFHETEEEALAGVRKDKGRLLSWAASTSTGLIETCNAERISFNRIEDGFLRSVGLGAGLAPGASLGLEDDGIYYDPSRPSRLQNLLQTLDLTDRQTAQGEALLRRILKARVSKYNVGRRKALSVPKDRETLLVPGQVADDAAIRFSASNTIACATTENVNRDLLRLTRQNNPEAYIVFKPHPDVETGLRKGKLSREEILVYADAVATNLDIIDCIEAVDGVETFSSLAGFEALLRGKVVTVHGTPFYAGWGLSRDLTPTPARSRKRSLPEMVYIAYVAYPLYVDPVSLVPCSAEVVIDRLEALRRNRWHEWRTTTLRRISWLGRKLGI